jgi:threonine/homoserine/homoserine lactone efflux protein
MRESAPEVTAIVAGSAVLFALVGWPFARLARAERLAPRWVRELPRTARQLLLTAGFLLLILTATNGATR